MKGNESRRSTLLRSIVLFILAVCTYLHLPLMSGDRLIVPSYPTVALIPLLFLLVYRDITFTDGLFIGKVTLVLLLSIGLSPGYRYVDEKFLSLVQCVMAVGLTILMVHLMHQARNVALERTLLALWSVIVVGVVLEVMGLIRGVSDAFREWAYASQYTIYDHDLRDVGLVGWTRPKLFSVEPSHVTKFFVASVNAWLLVRVTWIKAAVAIAATLGMLVLMGSPMLVVSAAMTLLIVMWDSDTGIGARVAMIFAALLLALTFGAFYASGTISTVGERLASIGDPGQTVSARPSSEQKRVVVPYVTLVDTWLRSPLFGVGIGGKEVVAEKTTLQLANPTVALGNNAFAEIGVYLGLAGSVWFIALLGAQFRRSGVRRIGLLAILIALFSQLMGGVVGFQYWGFIALIWGAMAVADHASSSLVQRTHVATSRPAHGHVSQW